MFECAHGGVGDGDGLFRDDGTNSYFARVESKKKLPMSKIQVASGSALWSGVFTRQMNDNDRNNGANRLSVG